MDKSNVFFRSVLNSITEHLVVIDEHGMIQFVNKSWQNFGANNACAISGDWRETNYLDECDKAAAMGDSFGVNAGHGIRSVTSGQVPLFYFEYPCNSPTESRWFTMRVTPLEDSQPRLFVISHQNITERKLAEEKVANLARLDGLTNLPNRRSFDEFLDSEWRRCARLKMMLSLAIIDIDHFKMLNDTYGHQVGDACLVKVGAAISRHANRPGDLGARYGGEEFAMIWGDTPLSNAQPLAQRVRDSIVGLGIANKNAPTKETLTVSMGLAATIPEPGSNPKELIERAEQLLYVAKKNGRDRIEAA